MEIGKVITFGHQKGGVGKSTLSLNLAAYLWKKGHKIAIIDCDDRDVTSKKIAEANDETPYPVITMNPSKLADEIDDYKIDYEFIFVDLPGTLSAKGVLGAYAFIDYVFIPSRSTHTDMQSTVEFINTYRDIYNARIEGEHETKVYLVFNFVKSRNNPELSSFKDIEDMDYVKIMKNPFPDRVDVQRNLSTTEYAQNFLVPLNEIYQILNN